MVTVTVRARARAKAEGESESDGAFTIVKFLVLPLLRLL